MTTAAVLLLAVVAAAVTGPVASIVSTGRGARASTAPPPISASRRDRCSRATTDVHPVSVAAHADDDSPGRPDGPFRRSERGAGLLLRAVLGCVVLGLVAAGCGNDGRDAADTTSSTTTTASTTTTPPSTTTAAPPPSTAAPAECAPFVTSSIGNQVEVVHPDDVPCDQAVAIVTRYLSPDTVTEGSGGYAEIDGWTCRSSSGSDAEATGVSGTCEDAEGRVIEMRTVSAPGPDSGPTTAVAFFQHTEALCAAHSGSTGNPTVPHAWFADAVAVQALPGGEWLIRDGGGHDLVVAEARGVIFSPDGPDAELPIEYSFGCPEDVYLGTMSH